MSDKNIHLLLSYLYFYKNHAADVDTPAVIKLFVLHMLASAGFPPYASPQLFPACVIACLVRPAFRPRMTHPYRLSFPEFRL